MWFHLLRLIRSLLNNGVVFNFSHLCITPYFKCCCTLKYWYDVYYYYLYDVYYYYWYNAYYYYWYDAYYYVFVCHHICSPHLFLLFWLMQNAMKPPKLVHGYLYYKHLFKNYSLFFSLVIFFHRIMVFFHRKSAYCFVLILLTIINGEINIEISPKLQKANSKVSFILYLSCTNFIPRNKNSVNSFSFF